MPASLWGWFISPAQCLQGDPRLTTSPGLGRRETWGWRGLRVRVRWATPACSLPQVEGKCAPPRTPPPATSGKWQEGGWGEDEVRPPILPGLPTCHSVLQAQHNLSTSQPKDRPTSVPRPLFPPEQPSRPAQSLWRCSAGPDSTEKLLCDWGVTKVWLLRPPSGQARWEPRDWVGRWGGAALPPPQGLCEAFFSGVCKRATGSCRGGD